MHAGPVRNEEARTGKPSQSAPPLEYRYEPGLPHVSLVSPHEPAPVVRNDVYPFHLHRAGAHQTAGVFCGASLDSIEHGGSQNAR